MGRVVSLSVQLCGRKSSKLNVLTHQQKLRIREAFNQRDNICLPVRLFSLISIFLHTYKTDIKKKKLYKNMSSDD